MTSVATGATLSWKPFSRAVARASQVNVLAHSPEWFSFLNGVTPGCLGWPKPCWDCHVGIAILGNKLYRHIPALPTISNAPRWALTAHLGCIQRYLSPDKLPRARLWWLEISGFPDELQALFWAFFGTFCYLHFSIAISFSPDECLSLVWAIFYQIPSFCHLPYHLIQPRWATSTHLDFFFTLMLHLYLPYNLNQPRWVTSTYLGFLFTQPLPSASCMIPSSLDMPDELQGSLKSIFSSVLWLPLPPPAIVNGNVYFYFIGVYIYKYDKVRPM